MTEISTVTTDAMFRVTADACSSNSEFERGRLAGLQEAVAACKSQKKLPFTGFKLIDGNLESFQIWDGAVSACSEAIHAVAAAPFRNSGD